MQEEKECVLWHELRIFLLFIYGGLTHCLTFIQALIQPALDLYRYTVIQWGPAKPQWKKKGYRLIPTPISTTNSTQCPWARHLTPVLYVPVEVFGVQTYQLKETSRAQRTDSCSLSEAYRLQELCDLCPCVWADDSRDTLLISIKEAAVGQLLMWTVIQCLAQGQLSSASALLSGVISFIFSFINTTHRASDWFHPYWSHAGGYLTVFIDKSVNAWFSSGMFALLWLEKGKTLVCPPVGPIHTEDKSHMTHDSCIVMIYIYAYTHMFNYEYWRIGP